MLSAAISMIAGCSDYVLKASAEPGAISPGGKGKLVIHIEARGKYHLDPDGRYLKNFEPPSGITLEKNSLATPDRGKAGEFTTLFTVSPAASKGPAQIKTKVLFQICTKNFCKFPSEERIISVDIR